MSAVIPADDGLGGDNDGSIDSSSEGADHGASTPVARVRNNRDDDMPEPRQHAYLPGASHPLS